MDISTLFEENLSQYASYDNVRSIASVADGLKNANRKVVYFTRNLKDYKKVSQLKSLIEAESQYLHADITDPLIGQACNYDCSNNINVLKPFSAIGNRTKPVAAAARYSLVKKDDIYDYIYRKEDEDVLLHQQFEGEDIEPRFLVPTLPMVLVNGAGGMGVGFAQNISPRNPKTIIKVLKDYLTTGNLSNERLVPSFKGFTGEISWVQDPETSKTQWRHKGRYSKLSAYELEIEEVLPYDTLESVLTRLNTLKEKKVIKSYKDYSTGNKFKIKVSVQEKFWKDNPDVLQTLGLSTTDTENYTCVNVDNCISIYPNEIAILKDFIDIKLAFMQKRKENIIEKLTRRLEIATSRAYFIKCVLDKTVIIEKQSKVNIISQLESIEQIKKIDDSYDLYIGMPLYSLSLEKIEELKKEVEKLKNDLTEMKNKTINQMWLDDINEIEKVL